MLLNRLFKVILHPSLRRFNTNSTCILKRSYPKNSVLLSTNYFSTRHRCYMNETQQQPQPDQQQSQQQPQPDHVILPPLFDEKPIFYLNPLYSVMGLLKVFFFIKPSFDKNFNIPDFMDGAKQAMVTVSHALAKEDYESLEGLITIDLLNNLKNKISTLNDEQKQLIAVDSTDVHLMFPFKIDINFGDGEESKKIVEITTVYFVLKGLEKFQKEIRDDQIPNFVGKNPEYRKYCYVLNYRFTRDYTEGVESSWIINKLNHVSSETF